MADEIYTYLFEDYDDRESWLKARKEKGLGASDAATMCGANPFHSSAELWQEKTGLTPPQPENDAMRRGHELEASVRDWFMNNYGSVVELEYHEFGIYSRSDYPMLFATLDGRLTVTKDFSITYAGKSHSFKEGEKIILEIKNPAPRSILAYHEWYDMPKYYMYQAAQQLFCTGDQHHILVANITGEMAKPMADGFDIRLFFNTPETLKSFTEEIMVTAPKFWEDVTKRQPAPVALDVPSVEVKGEVVALESKVNVGSIIENFDEVKSSVEAYASQFSGITFTETEVSKAKEFKAKLNSQIKLIDETKKSVKKKWNEPYDAFEKKCKDLIAVLQKAVDPISKQITDFEDAAKAKKRQVVLELIERIIREPQYIDIEKVITTSGSIPIKEQWLNKTTSMKSIESQIRTEMDKAKADYAVLLSYRKDIPEEDWLAVFSAFIKNGRSLSMAVETRDNLRSNRELQRKLEEERKAKEAMRAAAQQTYRPQPSYAPQPQPKPVQQEQPQKKTMTVTIQITFETMEQRKMLVDFLKSNGFHCAVIKN